MVTKLQAYQLTLDSLNTIWGSISSAADSWSRSPKMRPNLATRSVQAAIDKAIKDVTQNIGTLDTFEKKARNLLADIAVRLENFSKALLSEDVSNSIELVRSWKKTVENIIDDIAAQSPEIIRTPLYRGLVKKIAA